MAERSGGEAAERSNAWLLGTATAEWTDARLLSAAAERSNVRLLCAVADRRGSRTRCSGTALCAGAVLALGPAAVAFVALLRVVAIAAACTMSPHCSSSAAGHPASSISFHPVNGFFRLHAGGLRPGRRSVQGTGPYPSVCWCSVLQWFLKFFCVVGAGVWRREEGWDGRMPHGDREEDEQEVLCCGHREVEEAPEEEKPDEDLHRDPILLFVFAFVLYLMIVV